MHETWPNTAVPGQLSQDLPTWTHFEQATEIVTEDDATKSVPCGPDIVDEVVKSVRKYVDAGYDHLYFHQIGSGPGRVLPLLGIRSRARAPADDALEPTRVTGWKTTFTAPSCFFWNIA